MAALRQAQLRLVYSLLKPAVRAAARFHVPMRTLADLVRLAYFEHLRREGFTQAEIATRLGQSDRHMRSLARRLKGDFFAAEREVGIAREIEDLVASERLHPREVAARFPDTVPAGIDHALAALSAEGRIETGADGRLQAPARYHVLSSDLFHHRVDALNHFLDGVYRAVLHRLVLDERDGAMIKTISFTAAPAVLQAFLARFEGALRRDVATLEEDSRFAGLEATRYTLGVMVAPSDAS